MTTLKDILQSVDLPSEDGAGVPAKEAPKPQWADHWHALDAGTFTTKPPKRDWLIKTKAGDGVFPVGRVGLLNAEGGAGKTMALVQLALAVATGSTWLDAFTVPQAGRVLMILGEEDMSEVQRRLYNAGQANPSLDTKAALSRIVALPLQGVPCAMVESDDRHNVQESEFLTWLQAKLKEDDKGEPWRLIIVDPLSRFAGLDAEKDNAAATRFIQALESIATKTKAALLVAHHTNKAARGQGAEASTSAARGSSALTDGVRWACFLGVETLDTSDSNNGHLSRIATFTVTKSNYAKIPPSVSVRYSENGGALVPLTDTDWTFINDARKKAANDETRKLNAETRAKNAETKAKEAERKAAKRDFAKDAR